MIFNIFWSFTFLRFILMMCSFAVVFILRLVDALNILLTVPYKYTSHIYLQSVLT